MNIEDAKTLLLANGYVTVRWVPGASWAVGHSDEIAGNGLSIELTDEECRSAAFQITSIWEAHSQQAD